MKPFCYHPFDLRQLVSFAEIARTGSFRQAAKTLHVAAMVAWFCSRELVAAPEQSFQTIKLSALVGQSPLPDKDPHRIGSTTMTTALLSGATFPDPNSVLHVRTGQARNVDDQGD